MSFDWKKLTAERFKELCFDIFQSLREIEEIQMTAGTADLGQDIRAIETFNTLLGPSKRNGPFSASILKLEKFYRVILRIYQMHILSSNSMSSA